MTGADTQHTNGQLIDGVDRCPLCPGEHGGPGPCDHSRWSTRQIRFVEAHLEAYTTAYLNPDKRASSNEMARLSREYHTLPRGHMCWCRCPREDLSRGYPACKECQRLRADQKPQEPAEFGRTAALNAPMPDVRMLDLMAGYR